MRKIRTNLDNAGYESKRYVDDGVREALNRVRAHVKALGQQISFPVEVRFVAPDDIEGLRTAVTERTAAVIVEPLQGEGGVRPISGDMARAINAARADGGRVVAVGTTAVRTLESTSDDSGYVVAGSGICDLFIYPGFRFKAVDAMITNFHLPKSTLLMLVSAFAGRENILNAYREAVSARYRFFSYGDAMFIG
jgi:hypothetical protein